jgi:hypothetical protein
MPDASGQPQVAIVVCLAENSALGGARQAVDRILRRLADDRLPATCIAASSRQSGLLQDAAQTAPWIDAGLRWTPPANPAATPWAETARELEALRAAGIEPATLWCPAATVADGSEQTLYALGVRIVVGAAAPPGPQSAPRLVQGMWLLQGVVEAPAERSWPLPVNEIPWKSAVRSGARPAVVAIDLERVGGLASRGMRHVERLLTASSGAQRRGLAEFTGLGHWVRRQLCRNSGQPQRSILHAA